MALPASTQSRGKSKGLPSSNWPIDQLPGLSQDSQQGLHTCGIHTTHDLLRQTQTGPKKQAIAARLHIHPQHLNKWVALADLARIPAVGCQYCGLLLHAGIASPEQLVQTPLPRLHRQLLRLYVSMMQRQDLCPSLDMVAQWLQQARSLQPLAPAQTRRPSPSNQDTKTSL